MDCAGDVHIVGAVARGEGHSRGVDAHRRHRAWCIVAEAARNRGAATAEGRGGERLSDRDTCAGRPGVHRRGRFVDRDIDCPSRCRVVGGVHRCERNGSAINTSAGYRAWSIIIESAADRCATPRKHCVRQRLPIRENRCCRPGADSRRCFDGTVRACGSKLPAWEGPCSGL